MTEAQFLAAHGGPASQESPEEQAFLEAHGGSIAGARAPQKTNRYKSALGKLNAFLDIPLDLLYATPGAIQHGLFDPKRPANVDPWGQYDVIARDPKLTFSQKAQALQTTYNPWTPERYAAAAQSQNPLQRAVGRTLQSHPLLGVLGSMGQEAYNPSYRLSGGIAPLARLGVSGATKLPYVGGALSKAGDLFNVFAGMQRAGGTAARAAQQQFLAGVHRAQSSAFDDMLRWFKGLTPEEQMQVGMATEGTAFHAGAKISSNLVDAGKEIGLAFKDIGQKLVALNPALAERFYGGINYEKYFPHGNIWERELGLQSKAPSPWGGVGGPLGAKNKPRFYSSIEEGLKAGEKINPRFLGAEAVYQSLLKKRRMYALLQFMDELKRVPVTLAGMAGRAFVEPIEYGTKAKPTSLGVGLAGLAKAQKVAEKIAPRLARRQAQRFLQGQGIANPTVKQIEAAAESYISDHKAAALARLTQPRVLPGYLLNAGDILHVPMEGYMMRQEALAAAANALPGLRRTMLQGIYDAISDAANLSPEIHKGVEQLADVFTNIYHNVNTLSRQLIITNPWIHPLFNLTTQYLAAGGNPFMLLRALNPFWKPDATMVESLDKFGGMARMTPRVMQTSENTAARLATTPWKSLSRKEKFFQAVPRAAEFLAEKNQHFVFDIMERNIAATLYQQLLEGGAVEADAARLVRQALGDYDNITNWEKTLSKAFFFYPWLKTMTKFWAVHGLTTPGAWNMPVAGAATANIMQGAPGTTNPFSFALGKSQKGDFRYISPLLPQRIGESIASLAMTPFSGGLKKAENTLFGHFNPFIRAAYDVDKTLNAPASFPGGPNYHIVFDTDAPTGTKIAQIAKYMAGDLFYQANIGEQFQKDPLAILTALIGGYTHDVPNPQRMKRGIAFEKRMRGKIKRAYNRGDSETAARLYQKMSDVLIHNYAY